MNHWLDAISLDGRLAVRMLVKYRGLTLVAAFAMAVAIAIAATFFETLSEIIKPTLPMEHGERVVSLSSETDTMGSPERRVLHDFLAWRQELVSVEQLGAFRTAQHNLVTANAPPEPIRVAQITASGFAVAGTAPLLGRYLLAADERPDARPVVVIGHQTWQLRFGGDPQAVGSTVNLAGVPTVIVGVMPEGFLFPVDHQFWMPLREDPLKHEPLQGPELFVFGRLAAGVTLEQAQAELSAVGKRTAAAQPETHARLRPVVLPYTRAHFNLESPFRVWALRMAQLLVGALAFVVAINLAILVYARTVMRLGEIAVRTALGASRRRIVAQLFVEALALSVMGAAVGLALSAIALGRLATLIVSNGSVPYWIDLKLSAGTVIYALGLAVLAAVIMGVLPALKATGRALNANLRDMNARTSARLGPMWTTLVVAQVAVAVAVLPVSVYMAWQVVRMEVTGPGFAADQFVVSTVALSDEATTVDSDRIRKRLLELMSRLEAERGVSAVTFSSSIPGFAGSRQIQFEEKLPMQDTATAEVSTLDVGLEMFDTYGARMLAGRTFDVSDAGATRSVIVNRTFVRTFLDPSTAIGVQRSALGLRFRYTRARVEAARQGGAPAQPEWHQVIGVVDDFPNFPRVDGSVGEPTVYHPAARGAVHPMALSVRFSGSIPAGFIARLRAIGVEVDPAMQLRRVMPLSAFYGELRSLWRYLAWGIGLMTASVLLLSGAGIYALMSFTVAQRTHEIGIRVALGAHPRRLLFSIFGRALRQVALGLCVGSLLSGALVSIVGVSSGRAVPLLLGVAALMLVVGLLAAFGPARRSLHIQAIEALRSDG